MSGKMKDILEKEVGPAWMVVARHFGMQGGVIDYGLADIKEFFNTFAEADEYAKQLLINTHDDLIEPMIWVLRCEKTYQRSKEGLCVVISKNPVGVV